MKAPLTNILAAGNLYVAAKWAEFTRDWADLDGDFGD